MVELEAPLVCTPTLTLPRQGGGDLTCPPHITGAEQYWVAVAMGQRMSIRLPRTRGRSCHALSRHPVTRAGVTGASPEGWNARRQPYGVPKDRGIEMIRWLLLAAVVFLVIAALQNFVASRRGEKQVEGTEALPNLPLLTDATEVEHSRRELEELEQRLDIRNTGQQGKGA
jgi:hypothetical protein